MLIPQPLRRGEGEAKHSLEDIKAAMDAWLADGWQLSRILEMVTIERMQRRFGQTEEK